MSAHEALAALARDLVEEIAVGMALELAAGQSPAPAAQMTAAPAGPAAVHPHLGQHLARLPGDTISQHAYKHLQPEPAIAGQ